MTCRLTIHNISCLLLRSIYPFMRIQSTLLLLQQYLCYNTTLVGCLVSAGSKPTITYTATATHHYLGTGPRGQPWWCYCSPFSLKPTITYMVMVTHHYYLDTGPRDQPWRCYPFFFKPTITYMATATHHYLYTSCGSFKQLHSSHFHSYTVCKYSHSLLAQ